MCNRLIDTKIELWSTVKFHFTTDRCAWFLVVKLKNVLNKVKGTVFFFYAEKFTGYSLTRFGHFLFFFPVLFFFSARGFFSQEKFARHSLD